MFIPLRTDRGSRRPARVVPALIAITAIVHLLLLLGDRAGWLSSRDAIEALGLDPRRFELWKLLSYQFLHDPSSLWHIAFNMLFLWVFGAAVEGRFGRVGFAAFYLGGGAAAAFGHMLVSAAPVIGASGSVAAVSGAFLALFPRSRIKVLSLFIILGVFEVPSAWFIGLYFAVDLLNQTTELLGAGKARVAYMAHLAGYAFGFGLSFALLATKLIRREQFDVFFLLTQARRRAAMRAAVNSSRSAVWETPASPPPPAMAAHPEHSHRLTEAQARVAAARCTIAQLVARHDLTAAAAEYRALMASHPDAVLPEASLLDIANQLCAEGDSAAAAQAYESLLKDYPTSARRAEVRLMLGVLYARRLNQPARARDLLAALRPQLREPSQAALADQLAAELAT